MENPELIAKLKQAEQGAQNIKSSPDKKRRDAAIDTLTSYIRAIREGVENEGRELERH
jgi:hypothetical protein